MRVSKVAAAVAISTGLLMGCNGPEVVDESNGGGNSGGGTTPTSELAGSYWQISEPSSAAAQSSADLPNVYVFDGTTQRYYNDDDDYGTYTIYTTTSPDYVDDIDTNTLTFKHYDSEGNETVTTGTYEVVNGELKIDTSSQGELSGTDQSENSEVTAAVTAANDNAGFNNSVQIQDTLTTDVGELRLKLSDSSTGATVDSIASGRLTVDVIYQVDEDTAQDADGTGDNAYISLYTNGTSNKNLYGEVILSEGKVQYRGAGVGGVSGGSITDAGGTFTNGEKLAIEVTWGNSEFKFKVNGEEFTGEITEDAAVTVISLKIGDTSNTTNFEFIGDNLSVYSSDSGSETLVFEDDFDSYAVGQNLKGNPYNSSTSEATVIGDGDAGAPEPGDFPEAVHEYNFDNGDFTSDSGSDGTSVKWTGSAGLSTTTGALGDDATAASIIQDQATKSYGYAYYTSDANSGAEQIEGSFTLETVIKRNRANDIDVALVDWADTSNYLGYKLYIEGDSSSTKDMLKFKVYGGQVDGSNLSTEAVSDVAIVDDTWYHITAVYDETTSLANVYLNGIEVASKTVSWELAKNAGDKFILLGGASSSDKNFDGSADNIALWNVALTPEQIIERATKFGLNDN